MLMGKEGREGCQQEEAKDTSVTLKVRSVHCMLLSA